MVKKTSTQTVVSVPRAGELRTPLTKLRGISYLIELCGNLPTTPLDEHDCFYGVGLILADIHSEITAFADKIELWELHEAKISSDNRVRSSDVED